MGVSRNSGTLPAILNLSPIKLNERLGLLRKVSGKSTPQPAAQRLLRYLRTIID